MQKHSIRSTRALYKKCVENIEWFWKEVEKEVGIVWTQKYKKVLDISSGIPWAKWFVGGKTNISINCVDKHAFSSSKHKCAIIWEGEEGTVRKFTYLDLFKESERVARFLRSSGIEKGDAVGIFMPMIPEIASAIMGIAKAGGVVVPIFSGYEPAFVSTILRHCEAKFLFTADGFFRRGKVVQMKEIADEAVENCPSIEKVVVFPRLGINIPVREGRDVHWNDIPPVKDLKSTTESMNSEDTFMIMYATGTAGKPKGYLHVHAGFNVKVAQEVYHHFDLKGEDILFWFTDMNSIMGPWELVGTLTCGGSVFFYDGAPDYPEPGRLWELIEKHSITIFGFSPAGVRTMMKYGDEILEKYNLSSLRILGIKGGQGYPEEYEWLFNKVGKGKCPIINISGGKDAGACVLAPLPVIPLKVCSSGMPALGMDADVFSPEGKSVREEVGELVCKKPWPGMTRGLYKDEERYVKTYWSRWKNIWAQGDRVSVDRDGYWFVHGKSDETGGENLLEQ